MGVTITSPERSAGSNDLKRIAAAALILLTASLAPLAGARDATQSLHEPISVDARDDMAMGVVLEGDIPAAIQTRSGVFSAPDPNKAATRDEARANANAVQQAMEGSVGNTFTPDRDTRRPDVLRYVNPFTPATAPFKRLVAFDAVDTTFGLYTRDSRLAPLVVQHTQPAAGEDVFYADLALDIGPDRHARIPSVGPGARVLHAHLGEGTHDLPVVLEHDGADNWFVESGVKTTARLVMELSIPRAVFGGDFGDPDWIALSAPPVPENVASAARAILAHIGLGRGMRPAENVRRMVAYFRAFVDSDVPLQASRDVYTDLAMSQKGVCRHRAYAFTITALALGIPTRMVMNEAHAWVEVYDGSQWKRIDLGGAGRMLSEESNVAEPYAAPRDSFPWPSNATRGDDMIEKASDPNGPPRNSGSGTTSASSATPSATASTENDPRPASKVTLDVVETDTTRGSALHVKGHVSADGDACNNAVVAVLLHDPKSQREARIGSVAADAKGDYSAAIIVPQSVPLGDYDVIARTEGSARCGQGSSL